MKIKKKICLFNKNLKRAIQAVAIREVLGQYFIYEIIYADQFSVLLLLCFFSFFSNKSFLKILFLLNAI